MRRTGHLTPRYVWDRALLIIREHVRPDEPWLTRSAVALLAELIRDSDVGLEWGCGRSTVWLASRMRHLTSVEHDPLWAGRVNEMVDRCAIASKVRLVVEEDGLDGSAGSRYVAAADAFADESLDFCLVDGMARDHCVLRVLSKLKRGGVLVIDNANWYLPRDLPSRAPASRSSRQGSASAGWALAKERFGGWRSIWTTDGVSDTAIWIKTD